MRPAIRTRRAVSLLLSALTAALFVTPALAGSGNNLDVGRVFSSAAAMPAADFGAELALGSVGVRRPDGRIRLGTGPFIGNNVYNATGVNQTSTTLMLIPTTVSYERFTFGISIQNDGSTADRFTVKATGTAATFYTVAYFRGTTNITSAVVAGRYQTSSLAPGATYLITARVTGNTQATANTGVARLVTIRSLADPTKKDAVKFSVKTLAM
jgi:hypothetical protein